MCNINQMLKEQIQSYKNLADNNFNHYEFLIDRLDDLEDYEIDFENKKLNKQNCQEIESQIEKLKSEIKEYYGTLDVIEEYHLKHKKLQQKAKQIEELKKQIFKYKCQHIADDDVLNENLLSNTRTIKLLETFRDTSCRFLKLKSRLTLEKFNKKIEWIIVSQETINYWKHPYWGDTHTEWYFGKDYNLITISDLKEQSNKSILNAYKDAENRLQLMLKEIIEIDKELKLTVDDLIIFNKSYPLRGQLKNDRKYGYGLTSNFYIIGFSVYHLGVDEKSRKLTYKDYLYDIQPKIKDYIIY